MSLGCCKSIGILPTWFQYGVVKPFLYFVIYRVAHYRRAVVRDNLAKCFPDKDVAWQRDIENRFYWNFAEWIVDILDLSNISAEELEQRLDATRLGELAHLDSNAIVMMAHFGCWEYVSSLPMYKYGLKSVAVYHALEDSVTDAVLKHIRERVGAIAVERIEVVRFCLKYRQGYEGRHLVVGLLSDQTPPRDLKHHWFKFLGRPTVFVRGGEHLAVKLGLPVYFLWVKRTAPGHYTYSVEMIYDGVEQVDEYRIIERYVTLLERQIREQPEMWLWSHRRWKRKFNETSRQDYYARYPEEKPNEN